MNLKEKIEHHRNKLSKIKTTTTSKNWDLTRKKQLKYGIRNSHLMMIAPNTSTSLVQGCSASILPVFSKFYIDKNSKGAVPIMPPYIKEHFWAYQEFKNVPQKKVVDVVSRIQKWTDTGISMELLFNLNLPEVNARYMFDTLIHAWKTNIKTIYYIRSIQRDSTDVTQKKSDCISCAN